MPKQPFYADSMAFLALQGQPPTFNPMHGPHLSLAHVTSVPPTPPMLDFDAAFTAHIAFGQIALANLGTYFVGRGRDTYRDSGLGIVFGLQHAPNGLTFKRVRKLFDAGIRIMSLVYSGVSEYGSGSGVKNGLSKRGKRLLEWMDDVGMILDLSHANDKTALDALCHIDKERLFEIGVMASHSGSYAVHPHSRNLSDEIINEISALHGYVGIPAMNFMPGEDVLMREHIRHVSALCGDGSIGIGSDCPLVEDGSHLFKTLRQAMPDVPNEVFGQNFREFLQRSLPQT